MKAKKCFWASAVVVLFAACCCAGVNNRDVSSLAGLQGVYVQVGDLIEEAAKYGLTKKVLMSDVKSLLEENGIKLLSQQEYLQSDGRPHLFIFVEPIIHEKFGIATVNISIQLIQDVRLVRNPSIVSARAITWNSDGVLRIDLKFLENTRKRVLENLRWFIDDYLAANPKLGESPDDDEKVIEGTGTIRYVDIEGGFYEISADSGERYDPYSSLPQEYAKDGIRVKFTARHIKDAVGIHMSGKIVEILTIERIDEDIKPHSKKNE
jgi:hypothetical protein